MIYFHTASVTIMTSLLTLVALNASTDICQSVQEMFKKSIVDL